MSSPKYLSIEVVKPLLRDLLLVSQLLQGGGQRVELALQTVTLGRLQTDLEKTEAENFRNGAGISGNSFNASTTANANMIVNDNITVNVTKVGLFERPAP